MTKKSVKYSINEESLSPLDNVVMEESDLAPYANRYRDDENGIWLYQGNCLEILDAINRRYPEGRFDMIFADPPYFLSNGGITCHAGKMVKVDKGDWDKSRGPELNHEFNLEWLRRCQQALKPNGTIWEKPNPPPNLSCRYFTHSTETIIWAAKNSKSKHVFNYDLMRKINNGKQMKSVWTMQAPKADEKLHGKHPTQKPISLVERCILASTRRDSLVLDPFCGSGTTGVAALRWGRKFVGIDLDEKYLNDLAKQRIIDELHTIKNTNASSGINTGQYNSRLSDKNYKHGLEIP